MNALSLNLRAFAKLNEKHGPDGKEAERYRLAADEIDRLTALLKRHDDLCRKDESVGNDYVWTPELQELVEDTRAALKDTKP